MNGEKLRNTLLKYVGDTCHLVVRSPSSIRWPRIERLGLRGTQYQDAQAVSGIVEWQAPGERLLAGLAPRSSASSSAIVCAPI